MTTFNLVNYYNLEVKSDFNIHQAIEIVINACQTIKSDSFIMTFLQNKVRSVSLLLVLTPDIIIHVGVKTLVVGNGSGCLSDSVAQLADISIRFLLGLVLGLRRFC